LVTFDTDAELVRHVIPECVDPTPLMTISDGLGNVVKKYPSEPCGECGQCATREAFDRIVARVAELERALHTLGVEVNKGASM
jgi:hypothetical protein